MPNPLRHILRRPATSIAPTGAPHEVARRTVHDLRREAEGRAWAIRALRGETHLIDSLPPAGAAYGASDEAACDPIVALLTQLRAATTRYVLGLRAEGAPPEQMLVQVKAFVCEAMSGDGWTDLEATRALTEEVVRWSIAAYYDA